MTTDQAFQFVADKANVSKSIERLKRKRPSDKQLQQALEYMITNDVDPGSAIEALRLIEEYFWKENKCTLIQ